jgi:hypothetical protein
MSMPTTPGERRSAAPLWLWLMPGWFGPTVGAKSALRLSLSYCACDKQKGFEGTRPRYRTYAVRAQTFSFWYSLSLSLDVS